MYKITIDIENTYSQMYYLQNLKGNNIIQMSNHNFKRKTGNTTDQTGFTDTDRVVFTH